MYVTREKETYCHTCEKWFHYLGITNHRKAHRRRNEDCEITFTHGDTYVYEYSKLDTVQTDQTEGQSNESSCK